MANERFPVEKPSVLKPSGPGRHPLIRAVWLVGYGLLLVALAFRVAGVEPWSAIIAVVAAASFAAGIAAYVIRHARFLGTLSRGERALRAGDLAGARTLVAPLVDRYP